LFRQRGEIPSRLGALQYFDRALAGGGPGAGPVAGTEGDQDVADAGARGDRELERVPLVVDADRILRHGRRIWLHLVEDDIVEEPALGRVVAILVALEEGLRRALGLLSAS